MLSRRYLNVESVKHALLVLFVFLTFFPFWFMVMTSFKSNSQFYRNFWWPAFPLHPENYELAWRLSRNSFLNTTVVTVASVAGTLVVSAMAAYAFGRGRFPGRDALFLGVIGLMMFPGVLTLVPRFHIARVLRLFNTYWVLILPYIAGGQIMAIFIIRTFFAQLPEELFEAARMDGATEWQAFYRIALPMSKSILAVIAILNTLSSWNDYIWPVLTLTQPELRTVTVALTYLTGSFRTAYGALMAGYTLAALPLIILFVLFMRTFVEGMAAGAIKM